MGNWCAVLLALLMFTLWPLCSAKADDKQVKQRLKKLNEMEEKEAESEEDPSLLKLFNEKIWLNGFIEFNYEYLDVTDTDDNDSGSSSDFFIGSIDLAFRAFFSEWSKARVVVNLEDLGRTDGDAKLSLDEAIVTLTYPEKPFYFIGGKTVMPFGVFEDYLIEGTLAEDLYEIDKWGAIIGFAPDFYGLDLSFSVYKDATVIENLSDFDTHEFRGGRQKEDKFRSYVVNASLEPIEDVLTLGTFYNSEPGDGRRNRSAGGAATLNLWKLTFDTEYISALTREKGENEEENKESAWVVGLAWQLLEPLQLAARYEVFYDDERGDQDEVLDYNLMGGFNFEFWDYATFSVEYRYSAYEKEKDNNAVDSQKMLQAQLSLEF
ncbi:MAG: hypothetical protein QNI92_16710 [Desulfobacterales bacterium]|nr:hypothetical protein [Desulfobacterales bacterium]